jgi:hypothetical protein
MMRFLLLLFFSITLTTGIYLLDAAEDKTPAVIYLGIERKALLWYEGLFGSGNFYRRELTQFLEDHIGDEIEIDCTHILNKPLDYGLVGYSFDLSITPWLQVRGVVAKDDLDRIFSDKKNQDWWRHLVIVGVKGKIKRYYFDTRDSGKQLILFLDNMVPFVRSDNGSH